MVIKIAFLIAFSNIIYLKITNSEKLKFKNYIILTISGVVGSIIYVIGVKIQIDITAFIVANILNGLILQIFSNQKGTSFIFAYIISFIVSYALYNIGLVIAGIAIGLVLPSIEKTNLICMLIIIAVYSLLVFAFLKFKRIKNGFNFLKKLNIRTSTIVILFFVAIVIMFLIVPKNITYRLKEIVLISTMFLAISLLFLIKMLITKHYKNNIRDRNISIQKEEIDANEKVIEELKEQNLKLSTTIHKYNHRLSSLESSIRKVMDKSNAEFASELSIVLEQTKKVASQFAEETKVRVHIPSTNVVAIDNMLEYMKNEAIKSNIDFTLKLSDSIKPLLEKYIPEDKFETLLADHIKDAIIAINAKNDGYKSIMVLIGAVQGAYELSIYDTGVEFDIDTLLKLGTEPITTHKENGGSGLGFMTTFETLRLSKASLVIEEYDTSVTNYTKSVTIRFDGKCEYRIYSYRSEEINKACNGRKIIIKKI